MLTIYRVEHDKCIHQPNHGPYWYRCPEEHDRDLAAWAAAWNFPHRGWSVFEEVPYAWYCGFIDADRIPNIPLRGRWVVAAYEVPDEFWGEESAESEYYPRGQILFHLESAVSRKVVRRSLSAGAAPERSYYGYQSPSFR